MRPGFPTGRVCRGTFRPIEDTGLGRIPFTPIPFVSSPSFSVVVRGFVSYQNSYIGSLCRGVKYMYFECLSKMSVFVYCYFVSSVLTLNKCVFSWKHRLSQILEQTVYLTVLRSYINPGVPCVVSN